MYKAPLVKAVSENPFYGLRSNLQMLQQLSKQSNIITPAFVNNLLDQAWKEANSREKKELFFVILFSIGDITNREHNIFRKSGIKNVDQGGNSSRKTFLFILDWILRKIPNQFYAFLPLIGEYYNLDGMMFYELKTDRFKGTIKEVLRLDVDMNRVTDYIASVLKNPKTTENEKKLWAKWLWHIPTKTRQKKIIVTAVGLKSMQKKYGNSVKVGDIIKGVRQKQQATKIKDEWTLKNIQILSEKMDWEIVKHPNNIEYTGYKNFRKTYLVETEAAMFSSQRVKFLDKTELLNWFNQLPSEARFRVQKRLLNKDGNKLVSTKKWISNKGFDIADVYQDWLKSKEVAQQEVRDLTKEDKEKLKKENPSKLKQMEKAAKINTGGTTFLDIVAEFFKGGKNERDVNLVADSLLNKVNIGLPILGIVDTSGSMSTMAAQHNGVSFSAIRMAQLLMTVFLLKNPDQDASEMLISFDTSARILTTGQLVEKSGSNRFMNRSETIVGKIIDPTQTFSWNYNNLGKYISATGGGTSFISVATGLKNWVDSDPNLKSQRIEAINRYPVWVVLSDGDMNSHYNAAQSMAAFQQSMRQWFGWEGIIVIWDIKQAGHESASQFEGLENVIYYGGVNNGILTTLFTRIDDMDVIDVYTPLKSLHLSNRYEPIKQAIV